MESVTWNPWHGCHKISPGCAHCYVYRLDACHDNAAASSECHKTGNFGLPVAKSRDRRYKIAPGTEIFTCFTSDFFLEEADAWRPDAWRMIRERSDCTFFFFTKRIARIYDCLPPDWADGYENVTVGCTVENQAMADSRLPVFLDAPLKHRVIGVEPMLERVDLQKYLDGRIAEVSCGGESGDEARVCDYAWVLDLRRQCVETGTSFTYHQTGARLCKNGRIYNIPRTVQHLQAKKAGIDYILTGE